MTDTNKCNSGAIINGLTGDEVNSICAFIDAMANISEEM